MSASYESLDVHLRVAEADDKEIPSDTITTTRKVLTVLIALAIIGVLGVITNFSHHPSNTHIRLLNRQRATAGRKPTIFIHSDGGETTNPFAYSGALGPQNWAQTNPFCGGHKQSPINIVTTDVKGQGDEGFMKYKRVTKLLLQRMGHTVDVSTPGEEKYDKIVLNLNEYLFAQFHFHHPSEHTIDGVHADAEVHFVHTNDHSQHVVVALMCYAADRYEDENGESSKLLDYLLQQATFPTNSKRVVSLHPENMNILSNIGLGDETPAYEYSGSLTTPPCTETVTWFVIKKNFYLSNDALGMMKQSFSVNNRPIQKLSNRRVRDTFLRVD